MTIKYNRNLCKLLQERLGNNNPHRKLTTEGTKRLAKLEVISEKLKRRENVQNRKLQNWLSEEEYEQFEFDSTAKKFYNKSESLCKDALEILQEILHCSQQSSRLV